MEGGWESGGSALPSESDEDNKASRQAGAQCIQASGIKAWLIRRLRLTFTFTDQDRGKPQYNQIRMESGDIAEDFT